MKKALMITLNTILMAPFIFCFKKGAMVSYYMLPFWFIMSLINTTMAKNEKEIILYNGTMALFASVGIYICSMLYFKYVFWDSLGEAVLIAVTFFEVVYIAGLSAIECAVKRSSTNRKN